MMETILHDEFDLARDRWNLYPHDDSGKRFMQYLGVNHFYNVVGDFRMPHHAAHKVRLLLGPHHQTIIRAWYALNAS